MKGLRELNSLIERTNINADFIYNFVVHFEQHLEQASLFQGFTPDLSEAAEIYARIATLPRCLHELLGSNEDALPYRIGGEPYRIFPVQTDLLAEAFKIFKPRYCCIWSPNDEIAQIVEDFIPTHSLPILHISPSGTGNSVN